MRSDRCVMVCSRFHSPKLFLPPLLIAIFSFNYYRLSATDPVFTSPEVGVLRCAKHNLLSSPKINISNSFFNDILLKTDGSVLFQLQNKNTFRMRKSYVHIYIYPYIYIYIYPYIVTSAIHLLFSVINRSKCNLETRDHFSRLKC